MKYSLRKEINGMEGVWLDLGEEFVIDRFALQMMNHNDLAHLVPVNLVQWDGESSLQYDTEGMRVLSERLLDMLTQKDILLLFDGAIEAFEEIESYMLSEDELMIDMEHVYIDRFGRCRFICVPCKGQEEGQQLLFLHGMAKHMLQYGSAQEDTFLYELVNLFSGDGIRTLADLKEFLRRAKDTAQPAVGEIREKKNVTDKVKLKPVEPQKPETGKNGELNSEMIPKNGDRSIGRKIDGEGEPPKGKLPKGAEKEKKEHLFDVGYLILGLEALSDTGKEKKTGKEIKSGKEIKEFVPDFKIPEREEQRFSQEERKEEH